MRLTKIFMAIACLCATTSLTYGATAFGHAPMDVMGDHTHKKGEMMFSYRAKHMDVGSLREGSDTVSFSDATLGYKVLPTDMQMDMQMLGAMVALSDKVTAMVMVPYVSKTMGHKRTSNAGGLANTIFTRTSSGIGDIKANMLYTLVNADDKIANFSFGVSLPVGSINEKDSGTARLPYAMQLGSGTYDILTGLAWVSYQDQWSWGHQAGLVLRTGQNMYNYALGNQFKLTAWIAREWCKEVSTSFRVSGELNQNMSGADSDLNPLVIPTADSAQNRTRIDASLGMNYLFSNGILSGHRLGLEIGVPVYQRVSPIQLSTTYWITAGWQYAI